MINTLLYKKIYILCKTLIIINKNINIHFRFNFLNKQHIMQRKNVVFAINDDESILVSLQKVYIGPHTYVPKKITTQFVSGHHLILPIIENRLTGSKGNFCIVDNKLVTLFMTNTSKKYLDKFGDEKTSMNNWVDIILENDPNISEDFIFKFITYQTIENEKQLINYLFTKVFSEDELSNSYLSTNIDQLTKKILSGVSL